MSEAREIMDRMTAAMASKDLAALAACYAEDAVAVTPDQGELRGRDAIRSYMSQLTEAFPVAVYESLERHEVGSVAIDEGFLSGPTPAKCIRPQVRLCRRRVGSSGSEAVMLLEPKTA